MKITIITIRLARERRGLTLSSHFVLRTPQVRMKGRPSAPAHGAMPSAPGGLVNYALRVAVAIAAVSIAAVVVVIDPQAAHLLGQVLRRCVLVVLDIPLERFEPP